MPVQQTYQETKAKVLGPSFFPAKTKGLRLKASPRQTSFPDERQSRRLKEGPPLKWAGGKRWLIPHIEPYWKKHSSRRLVEPFCGGLAVALGLRPGRALLNDLNQPLIHFFKSLQEGFTARSPFKNEPEFYYAARKKFNKLLKEKKLPALAAELFYYLNRTGYNGLCRFNRRGEFNTPFGSYKSINYRRDFSAYSEIFKTWSFSCLDFERLRLFPDDFVYADPPYDVEFTKYAPQGFSFEDQKRLAEFLSQHKGPVILSNQATRRIKKLYAALGFRLSFLKAPRRISCNGNRSPAKELLAFKNI